MLKVDTEASGENKALAMDASIRAFPTFHYYLKVCQKEPYITPKETYYKAKETY